MKLLFIVESMGGGVFTYIADLANQLVDYCDMYIAYAVRPQTPADYTDYFDNRIHLIKIRHFTRSLNPAKDYMAFFEIRKVAKRILPDIIHLHSSKAGALGRWAFNGHKIPLFYTPHGYSFFMSDCSKMKRAFYYAIEAICAKRYCTTISCSKGEHQETLRITKRAAYVDNGIRPRELDALFKNIVCHDHPFTVFTTGRICYQKNPALFNAVAEAVPDAHFLWIGDGEMRRELKASNIQITGWKGREEALRLSADADVFMLTSRWEGLPVSLLEAMYMKKLCIVSDVIGNHDVIHNNQNGFICVSKEDFVKAIRRAQADDVKKMIETAYTEIGRHYNTEIMSKQYLELYKKAGKTK